MLSVPREARQGPRCEWFAGATPSIFGDPLASAVGRSRTRYTVWTNGLDGTLTGVVSSNSDDWGQAASAPNRQNGSAQATAQTGQRRRLKSRPSWLEQS